MLQCAGALLRLGAGLAASVSGEIDFRGAGALGHWPAAWLAGLQPANLVACGELIAANQLDGFGPRQRVRVSFSGPVNPDTLKAGIFIVWLEPVGDRVRKALLSNGDL